MKNKDKKGVEYCCNQQTQLISVAAQGETPKTVVKCVCCGRLYISQMTSYDSYDLAWLMGSDDAIDVMNP